MSRAKKIPVEAVYTAKVEALLEFVRDFDEPDFLALACAAADQAGADTETVDKIHALITADMEQRAAEREREEEDKLKDKQRKRREDFE